jgi:hypothetical protein
MRAPAMSLSWPGAVRTRTVNRAFTQPYNLSSFPTNPDSRPISDIAGACNARTNRSGKTAVSGGLAEVAFETIVGLRPIMNLAGSPSDGKTFSCSGPDF